MIKRLLWLSLVLISFTFAGNEAKKNAVGGWVQGGNAGENFGLDWKMRRDGSTVLDLYFHFDFSKHENALAFYAGYYFEYYNILVIPPEAGRIGLYWGPAGGIGWWNHDTWHDAANDRRYDFNGIALRLGLVGGIGWDFPQNIPLELYLEVNPVGEFHLLIPEKHDNDTDWRLPDVYFRLGLRFWF